IGLRQGFGSQATKRLISVKRANRLRWRPGLLSQAKKLICVSPAGKCVVPCRLSALLIELRFIMCLSS
ncbi:MAG: hypothetical protein KAG97_13095, partial [Victivallales bacterium]|nr:hypothetical protein [Victivallales bacterium]